MIMIGSRIYQQWTRLSFVFLCSSLFIHRSYADCSDDKTVIVRENEPVGTFLASFTTNSLRVDRCRGCPLYNNQLRAVKLAEGNWSVEINQSFDAETMPDSLTFDISCTDQGGTASSLVLNVILTDVDEYPPEFKASSFSIQITENTKVASNIFSFKNDWPAIDSDKDKESISLQYVLITTADGRFAINDQLNGVVELEQPLDYDSGKVSFSLNVSVQETTNVQFAGFTTLIVNVTDVDDLNPVFSQEVYNLQIPEGLYTGTEYLQPNPAVSAHDGDRAINQPIFYTLDSTTRALYGSLFDISRNGSLNINGYLKPDNYTINIKACQVDNPVLRYAVAILVVTVNDINNNKPAMLSSLYSASISELAPIGTTVLTVAARDLDEGDNGVFKFMLQGNPANVFDIVTDQTFGHIVLKTLLDRETTSSHTFQVYAKETKTKELYESQRSSVTITVLDENDNSPVFTNLPYSFKLNRTATGFVGQVTATDVDAQQNGEVVYSLQPSSFSSAVTVDPKTGRITLTRNLVSADVGTYSMIVKATDNSIVESKRRWSLAEVVIQVLPVNDHAPYFVGALPYLFNISESTPANSLIGQISAVDADGDRIQYVIKSGNDDKYLRLDLSSGELFLIKENDLDSGGSTPYISLSVSAMDGLHETVAQVNIIFEYANEFDPVFISSPDGSVNENAVRGTRIITVSATDQDRDLDGQLVYSLVVMTYSSNFVINPSTGVISLACDKCLSYSVKNSYDLVVRVQDRGKPPRLSLTAITVNVTQTTFAPPKFTATTYNFQVLENTVNYFQLDATDFDTKRSLLVFNSSPPYQPTDVPFLTNVFSNGTIHVRELDAEKSSSLTFGVVVTDGVSIDKAIVIINVTDVNDNDPVLQFQSPVNVLENAPPGQPVSTISAKDADISNAGFTYYIETGTDGKFQVNPTTGVITTAGQFDRRLKSLYNFSVNVLDHGSPPLSDSKFLVVSIVDSNTAPIFVEDFTSRHQVSGYNFTVPEDSPVRGYIGSLYAYDPDFGSSGQVKYTILYQDHEEVFSLGSSDGQLMLNTTLNFELKNSYTLIVTASDNSFQPKTATATVEVKVINVIEAPEWPLPLPVIYFSQASTCNPQVQAVSQEVTTLTSKGDEGVEYKLLNHTSQFRINSSTGHLQVTTTLSSGNYTVGLAACAKGTAVCSSASLKVVVSSSGGLTFCPAFVNVLINETNYVNFSIQDLDTNRGDTGIHYAITSGNTESKFWIQTNDGKLYVNGDLDRETTPQYILTVTATQDSTKETAQAQIMITVLDLPDTAPEFQLPLYLGEISEADNVGAAVKLPESSIPLQVQATDKDFNAKLSYSTDLNEDSSSGSFQVDPVSGAITLAKKIDFDTMPRSLNSTYVFKVKVTDGVFTNSCLVHLKVIDSNDNSPVFNDITTLVIDVLENAGVSSVIGVVLATDADSIDSGKLYYSLTLVSPIGQGNPFKVESNSGNIVLEDSLDRERVPEYLLNITVKDLAGHTAVRQVQVRLKDVNDNPPVFFNTTYYMNVTEDRGLKISATPSEIIVGQTGYLIINCSFSHPPTKTSHLASLVLYSSTAGSPIREIVSANTFTPLTVAKYVDLESGFVYKAMYDDVQMTSYIALLWIYPSQADTVYSCEANTLDIYNLPERFTTAIRVVRKGQASITELVQELHSLGNRFFSTTLGSNILQSGQCSLATDQLKEEAFMYREMFYSISDPFENLRFYLYKVSECSQEKPPAIKAFQMCEAMGGHMARIENARLLGFVTNFLKSQINFDTSVLISGHDEERFDQWVYHGTDQPLSFFDWATSEPGAHTAEGKHCLSLGWSGFDLKMMTNFCGPEGNGTQIFIKAFDPDNDTNAETLYTFVSGNENKDFELILLNDQLLTQECVRTIRDLDREELMKKGTATMQLIIKAFDKQDHGLGSSTCTVLVTVLDMNDNSPVFSANSYTGEVLESATSNICLQLSPPLSVTDPDNGENGTAGVVFSLRPEEALNYFMVEKSSGSLCVNLNGTNLDKETKDSFFLQILAADQFGKGRSSAANITVTVLDVNDEKPEFEKTSYNFSVSEKTPIETAIGAVRAKDMDRGTTLYYLKGSYVFGIQPLDGTILVMGNLDRKVQKNYWLNVSACDVELPESSGCSFVNVTISVMDANDHCPVWNASSLYMTVSENSQPGSVIGHLIASDDDDEVNGMVTFFTNTTESGNYINITANGDVVLLHVIDNSQTLKFPVYAQDGGSPKCIEEADLVIRVYGVNKFNPVICFHSSCGPTTINLTVIVDAKSGSVIGHVTSYDNDTGVNGETYYYLPDTSLVNITTAGFIQLTKDITQSQSVVDVPLLVIDRGTAPRNSSTNLHIVPESASSKRPVFTNVSYTFSVQENTDFVNKVVATQGDGKSVNYSMITEENRVPFTVAVNGTISNTRPLDREIEDMYEFIVSATVIDQTSLFSWTLVKVYVTDANDNPPLFDDNDTTVTVPENAVVPTVTQLHATDIDLGRNKEISYSLVDQASYPEFVINSTSGILSVIQQLDREIAALYTFYVRAKDNGNPSLSSTATVHVLVDDVNDNAPVFSQPEYVFNINALGNTSQVLNSVTATDKDEGINQRIVYTLEEIPDDSGFFYIDPLSGVLSTIQKLSKSSYTFKVKAADLGSPILSGTANVTIKVQNNDVIPTLSVRPDSVTLYVGMSKGFDLNVILNYSNAETVEITVGNERQIFQLVNKRIYLAQDLLQPQDYTLVVTASNRPVSEHTISVVLHVSVQSVEFDQTNYLATLPENFESLPKVICQLGSPVQKKVAVKYSLNNFTDKFRVGIDNGTVLVVMPLDRESTPVYVLNVSVSVSSSSNSQGRKKRQAGNAGVGYTSVVVQVLDVNDNAPTFGNNVSSLYFNIPATAADGSHVTKLQAYDPDEGLNGQISYKITTGSNGVFLLNSQTGELKINNSTLLTSKLEWDMTVSATDMNGAGTTTLVDVLIYVQNGSTYTLQASIPLSLFNSNQKEILRSLSNILGMDINFIKSLAIKDSSTAIYFSALDPKSNSSIATNDISKKVQENLADISELFYSYLKSSKASNERDEGAFGTTSIVLIVIACVMFVVSLLAILFAFLMWKKQKLYAKKEENAARVRERLGEQMNHKVSNAGSDPDEHLEMDIDFDDSNIFSPEMFLRKAKESEIEKNVDDEEQESSIVFETEFKSEVSTVALRQRLVDIKTHQMQQLFQSISLEEEDREGDTEELIAPPRETPPQVIQGKNSTGRRNTEVIYEEDENEEDSPASQEVTEQPSAKKVENDNDASVQIYDQIENYTNKAFHDGETNKALPIVVDGAAVDSTASTDIYSVPIGRFGAHRLSEGGGAELNSHMTRDHSHLEEHVGDSRIDEHIGHAGIDTEADRDSDSSFEEEITAF